MLGGSASNSPGPPPSSTTCTSSRPVGDDFGRGRSTARLQAAGFDTSTIEKETDKAERFAWSGHATTRRQHRANDDTQDQLFGVLRAPEEVGRPLGGVG